MLGGIRLTTVVLLTLQLLYGTVSSNQDKIVSGLKELVERIQGITNTVTNKIQDLPEKRKENHFGSLNKLLDDATNSRPIDNVNKDSKIFLNQLSDVFKKEKSFSNEVNAVGDDEIVPRSSSILDNHPGNLTSGYEVFEVDKDIEFSKEHEQYPSPIFNMYNKVGDNKKNHDQRDPTNEKGDNENDAYWVDKEDPQNYVQQGPTVLEQLLKQKNRHDNHHKHHKKRTYLKPNDLTGYAGLFDFNNEYDQPENDYQTEANQLGDFKSLLKNYNAFQDHNNLQSYYLNTHVPSDLQFQKPTDFRSLSDGTSLDKYSKVYVILNPQALKKPKPKSKVAQLLSRVFSNLLKNKGVPKDNLKYRDYLGQSRRRQRRSINVQQIDLSESDGEFSTDEVYEPKRKRAPVPKRPIPVRDETSDSASEGGGSAIRGGAGPKVGFGGGQKFGGENKGFKALGGNSKGNIGIGRPGSIRSGGSGGGSFGGNKGSKVRGGRSRGGSGVGRSGGAGRTSIPYIGGGRNVYEKKEYKYE